MVTREEVIDVSKKASQVAEGLFEKYALNESKMWEELNKYAIDADLFDDHKTYPTVGTFKEAKKNELIKIIEAKIMQGLVQKAYDGTVNIENMVNDTQSSLEEQWMSNIGFVDKQDTQFKADLMDEVVNIVAEAAMGQTRKADIALSGK